MHAYDFWRTYKLGIIKKDTMIKNKKYFAVFKTSDSVFNINTATYYGALREDSNKKWFSFMPFDTTERLIYDFDCKINDSVNVFAYDQMKYIKLKVSLIVPQIFMGEPTNQVRKCYTLEDRYADKYALIFEGFGIRDGDLLKPYIYLDTFSKPYTFTYNSLYVLCFEGYGYFLQHFSGGDNCYVYRDRVLSLNDLNDNEVSIYPNPIRSGEEIVIKNARYLAEELVIYNSTGKIIQRINLKNSLIQNFQMHFSSGIYYYFFRKDNIKIKCGKLIVL